MVIEEKKVVDASLSSSLPICLGLLTGSSNSVYQAFHLLQTNPKVQVWFHSPSIILSNIVFPNKCCTIKYLYRVLNLYYWIHHCLSNTSKYVFNKYVFYIFFTISNYGRVLKFWSSNCVYRPSLEIFSGVIYGVFWAHIIGFLLLNFSDCWVTLEFSHPLIALAKKTPD